MRLIIDTRETGSVAKELDVLGTAYTIEPLHVGDFAIKDDDAFIAVWERKSCADLAASINDGRYAEQKGRLLALECRWKGYLLEGYYPEAGIRFPTKGGKTSVVPRSTVDSVKLGLMLRDGFSLYELADCKHTAIFLTKMMAKLPEYLQGGSCNTYEESLIKSISTVRKENMTPEVCYIAQLCQIPGVSHGIAQAIHTVYPNMQTLLNLDITHLTEIPVSSSRRLGKVLAQRIYDYMGIGVKDVKDVKEGDSKNKLKPLIIKKIGCV
jgi:ERCC4-type nuclease